MKAILLDVNGMTCDHCANAVCNALSALPGVEKVEADVMSNCVRVELDESLCETPQLVEAVCRAGYNVTGYHPAE